MKTKNKKKFKIVLYAAAGALATTIPAQADHLRGDANSTDRSLEVKGDMVREPSGADATYQHEGALCDLDAQADSNLRLFQRGKQAAEMTERQLHATAATVIFPADMDSQYQNNTTSFTTRRGSEYQSRQTELQSNVAEPSGAAVKTEINTDASSSPKLEVKTSETVAAPAPAPIVAAPAAEIKTEVSSTPVQEPAAIDTKREVSTTVTTQPAAEASIKSESKPVEAQVATTAEPSAPRAEKAAEIQSGAINEAAGADKSAVTTGAAVESPSEIKAGEIQAGKTKTLPAINASVSTTDSAWNERLHASLMSDPALSATAPNVTVTSANGKMVLRGTVKSDAEKQAIGTKAEAIVGADKVDNQLEVKSE